MEYNSQLARVFTPWKTHNTLLGVPFKKWGAIAATLAAGLALFLAGGLLKVDATVQTTTAERLSAKSELQQLRTAMQAYEDLAAASGDEDPERLGLTEQQRAQVETAMSRGVAADTSDERLSALVPTTKQVQAERFDPVARFFACILLPSGLMFAWNVEVVRGCSMSTEFRRLCRFRARQRFYVSRKRDWLSRKEG